MLRSAWRAACSSISSASLLPRVGLDTPCLAPFRLARGFATKVEEEAHAYVFDAVGKPLRMESRPVSALMQELGPQDVLVRMDTATICGSDLHTISGQRKEPTPLVLGHEGVGHIAAFGSLRARQETSFQVGDRVTWSIADTCGTCPSCAQYALPQKCAQLFKYGHAAMSAGQGFNGTYATHIVLRGGTYMCRLPDALPSRHAAPANCALATVVGALSQERLGAVAPSGARSMEALVRRAPLSSAAARPKTALVQGAGLLGLYSVLWLRRRHGFSKVFCVDTHPGRLAIAQACGAVPLLAQAVGDHAAPQLPSAVQSAPRPPSVALTALTDERRMQTIREGAGGLGVDVVVEVAGAPAVVPEGVKALRFGGLYVLLGLVHPNSRLDVTGEELIRKCATVVGMHNYAPSALKQAVDFLAEFQHELPLDLLVSPARPFAALPEAVREADLRFWPRVAVDLSGASQPPDQRGHEGPHLRATHVNASP